MSLDGDDAKRTSESAPRGLRGLPSRVNAKAHSLFGNLKVWFGLGTFALVGATMIGVSVLGYDVSHRARELLERSQQIAGRLALWKPLAQVQTCDRDLTPLIEEMRLKVSQSHKQVKDPLFAVFRDHFMGRKRCFVLERVAPPDNAEPGTVWFKSSALDLPVLVNVRGLLPVIDLPAGAYMQVDGIMKRLSIDEPRDAIILELEEASFDRKWWLYTGTGRP